MDELTKVSNEVVSAMFGEPIRPKSQSQSKPAPKDFEIKMSFGGGVFYSGNYGGGIMWSNKREQVTMPYNGGGAYLFFDATYAEAFLGFSGGGGKWASNNATSPGELPDMSRMYINFGVFGKYPVILNDLQLFGLAGIDYEASIFGELKYDNGREYPFDGNHQRYKAGDLSALWFKFGGGLDVDLNEKTYLRFELLYGIRTANALEKSEAKSFADSGAETVLGHGLDLKAGVGFKF
jgi:hypothetical protein